MWWIEATAPRSGVLKAQQEMTLSIWRVAIKKNIREAKSTLLREYSPAAKLVLPYRSPNEQQK